MDRALRSGPDRARAEALAAAARAVVEAWAAEARVTSVGLAEAVGTLGAAVRRYDDPSNPAMP